MCIGTSSTWTTSGHVASGDTWVAEACCFMESLRSLWILRWDPPIITTSSLKAGPTWYVVYLVSSFPSERKIHLCIKKRLYISCRSFKKFFAKRLFFIFPFRWIQRQSLNRKNAIMSTSSSTQGKNRLKLLLIELSGLLPSTSGRPICINFYKNFTGKVSHVKELKFGWPTPSRKYECFSPSIIFLKCSREESSSQHIGYGYGARSKSATRHRFTNNNNRDRLKFWLNDNKND